jgi:peptidoglycan/xylan/chitin deacetylase (PgdA/CDA1 family)
MQLLALKEQWDVLPLRVFAGLHRERRLQPNAVAITFDDGYACNLLAAAPLLAKHQLPATFFLTAGAIGAAREFWWDELARLIFESGATTLRAELDGRDLSFVFDVQEDAAENFDAAVGPRTARETAYLTLWQALKRREADERSGILDRLWDQCLGRAPSARASHRPMTSSEVETLQRSGIAEIGAHTMTHPALSELDRERQKREIALSRDVCEALAGEPVTSFAYPYGDLDQTSVDLVRETGFDVACTTEPKTVARHSDALRLPRLQVGNWDLRAFSSALEAVSAGRR